MGKTKKMPSPEKLEPPLPPDGGWGWVVMVASFFSNLMVDGVLYTFGILLTYLTHAFPNDGKAKISLVGSLLGGMYLIVGPFVGGLANKFGCRPVAVAGAIVASTSFIASSFSQNIESLLVSYGIFGGIGFGLLYLPSIVMVGTYFDRKRALATGLAVCGSGIGTFIFAPLASHLCDQYGWRGANLIIGAIILHGIACAMVYRPLKSKKKSEIYKLQSDVQHKSATGNDDKKESLANLSATSSKNSKTTRDTLLEMEVTDETENDRNSRRDRGDDDLPDARPLYRADVLYGGSVSNLPEFNANPDMRTYVNSVTDIPRAVDGESSGGCAPALDIFKKMFDFSLLLSPSFIIICLSGVFGFMGFYTPFVYLTDYAQLTAGATKGQASLLVSAIGISNTVSRVLAGWIADRPWADSALIHSTALILAGVATAVLPMFTSLVVFFVYAVVFGFSIAAFIALRSIVICDLLGVQKLTNAFGIVALFQGIALLLGTPLSGAIFDSTGSYKTSFMVAGGIMILGGLICLPVRRINRWELGRNRAKSAAYAVVGEDAQGAL